MNTLKTDRCGYTNLLNSAIKELLTYPPDITIFAQDGKLEVNRLLFSMYSPTLNAAISQCFPSSSILLPDYSIASVRILIDLLETGFSDRKDFPAQDFENVLEIANHLRIQLNNNNVQAIENEAHLEGKNELATKTSETEHDTSLSNYITKPEVKQSGEESIDEVTCKGSMGEFHQDKFISGGEGPCIFSNGIWMTPNEFEKLSGSKARKYKESIRVNGTPLGKVIDLRGTRQATPSVQQRQSVKLIKGKSQLPILAKSERVKEDQTSKLWKQKEDCLLNKKYQKDTLNSLREVNAEKKVPVLQDTTHKSNVKKMVPHTIFDFTGDEEIDFSSIPVFVAIEENIPNVDESSTLHTENAAVQGNSANIDDRFTENSVMKNSTANIDHTYNEMIESKAYFELKNNLPKATSQTKQLNDDTSNDFTKPNLKQDEENSVYAVTCKESVGEFHQDKFISGGKGHCIFSKGIWLTPNEFERGAGSRAKKYKASLRVNGEPIGKLIDPSGTKPTTPSVQPKPSSNLNSGKSSKIPQLSNLVKSVPGNQRRQSASLKKSNAQINTARIPQISNLVKSESVQGNQIKGSTSKLRKPDGGNADKENDINPPRDEGSGKRKKQFTKGNNMRNVNLKKILLDKMYESNVGANSTWDSDPDEFFNIGDDITSGEEIDLSGTPVFMALQDDIGNLDESYIEKIVMKESTSNMDESYTEDAVLINLSCIDNYGSPIVSKTKIKQMNDNDVAEIVDLGQFEKEKNSPNESADVSQFDTPKLDDKNLKLNAKKDKARYSEGQTSGLRKAFNENNFLSKEKAYTLSQELCLTEKQIKVWFNNSRAQKRLSTAENQKYTCELCLKSFVNKSKLIKHMSSHDSGVFQNDKTNDSEVRNDGTNVEDETQCRCDCGAMYNNALLFKFHKNEDCMTTYVKQGVSRISKVKEKLAALQN